MGARDVTSARRWVDEASLTVRGARDRRDEFERLRGWLSALGVGDADPQLFLPADWREQLAGVWNGDDLRGTERRLRRLIASRADATTSPIDEQLAPYFDLEGLRARALLDAGRNEDALVAIDGVIQQGVPWWYLQVRDLGAGRLAALIGDHVGAYDRFTQSLMIPDNGVSDADYLLQALIELARIDGSLVGGAPDSGEWADLALVVAADFSARIGDWFTAEIEEELRMRAADRSAKPADAASVVGSATQWQPYIDGCDHVLRERADWDDEIDQLHESLEAVIVHHGLEATDEHRARIDALWLPLDPRRSQMLVSDLLLDAYAPNSPADFDEPAAFGPLWSHTTFAQTRLEVLLARACLAVGDFAAADSAQDRAFRGYSEASGWVLQLSSLASGRFASAAGDIDDAFDHFWQSLRRVNSPAGDLDLALEAVCELAMLGEVSPAHPAPEAWAGLAVAMARVPGAWRPVPSFYDEYLGRFERMLREAE